MKHGVGVGKRKYGFKDAAEATASGFFKPGQERKNSESAPSEDRKFELLHKYQCSSPSAYVTRLAPGCDSSGSSLAAAVATSNGHFIYTLDTATFQPARTVTGHSDQIN